jgi:hypothetical protein
LFALAVVGYKCRMKRAEVERDALDLAGRFASLSPPGRPFSPEEAVHALRGFDRRFTEVSSEELEGWLGFKFPRLTKRNGKSRGEHLAMVRDARRAAKEKRAMRARELLAQGLTKGEVADLLGMSLRNLYKSYGGVLAEGAADEREGEIDGV